MSASFPSIVKIFTEKTDKVDLVAAAHINDLQNEVTAIETELGTDPAGSCTDAKTRLYVSLDNDGAIRKGTSFPVAGLVDGMPFYRTDLNTLFVYNGATWDSVAQSLGGTMLSYGVADIAAFAIPQDQNDAYSTMAVFKVFLPLGATAIEWYVHAKNSGTPGTTNLRLNFDGTDLICEVSVTSATYAWLTAAGTLTLNAAAGGWATLTVQGKDNGTSYYPTIDAFAISFV